MSSNNNPDKDKEDRDKSNLFSSLWDKVTGLFGSFSSIFTMALIAIVGYYIMTNDKAKAFIGGLLDKVPDSWGFVKDWANGLKVLIGAPGAVSEIIDPITDATKARDKLSSYMPASALAIIAKDDGTWKNFKDAIETNGKLSKKSDVISDKTIEGLITKQPDMVIALFKTMAPTSGTTLTKDQQDMLDKIATSLRAIANGPLLKDMFTIANSAATLKVLAELSKTPTTPEKVKAQLTLIGALDANGQPTATMIPVFNQAINSIPGVTPDNSAGTNQSKSTSNVTNDNKDQSQNQNSDQSKKTQDNSSQNQPDANLQVTAAQNLLKLDPAAQKAAIKQTGLLDSYIGAANVDSFIDIVTTARIAKNVQETANISADQMKDAQIKFWMNKDNIGSFKDFADAVAKDKTKIAAMPAEMRSNIQELAKMPKAALVGIANNGKNPLEFQTMFAQPGKTTPEAGYVMAQLLNQGNRNEVVSAGAGNVGQLMQTEAPDSYKFLLKENNLRQILGAADKVDAGITLKSEQQNTMDVTKAIVDYEADVNQNFLHMAPEKIAKFFAKKQNDEAIYNLFGGLQGFAPHDQAEANALKATWWGKNGDKTHGLSAVMADAKGVKYIQDQMLHPSTGSHWEITMRAALAAQGGVVAANADSLIAFEQAMEKAPDVTPAQPRPKAAPHK